LFPLVGTFPFPSSDHRLVWADVKVADDSVSVPEPSATLGIFSLGILGIIGNSRRRRKPIV
jgi:hypothetical protein